MNTYTFEKGGFTFTRINRTKARNAYHNGLTVILCPCNLNPASPWGFGIALDPRPGEGETFESRENAFTFYNCTNSETGRRPAYYIPVRPVDWFTGEPLPKGTPSNHMAYDYSFMKGDEDEG